MDIKKVIVIGANGYLAKNTINYLSKKDDIDVVGITRSPQLETDVKSNIIYLNQEDLYEIEKYVDKDCDLAINFSWEGTRGEKQNDPIIQAKNKERYVEVVKKLVSINCKNIIQIGSISEYGEIDGVINEKTECHPITEYGKNKLECSRQMMEVCANTNTKFYVFKIGSMYGNYMETDNLIGFICNKMKSNDRIVFNTKCMQKWEFTHVDDLSELIYEVVVRDIPSGIYNISNGDTHPLRYFIDIIGKKYGYVGAFEYPDEDVVMGCKQINCDIQKLLNTFKKRNYIAFESGIESVLKHYK